MVQTWQTELFLDSMGDGAWAAWLFLVRTVIYPLQNFSHAHSIFLFTHTQT